MADGQAARLTTEVKPVATKRKVTVIPHSERKRVRLPVACEMLGDVATSTIYKMKDRGLLEQVRIRVMNKVS